MKKITLPLTYIKKIVESALIEDIYPSGDITTNLIGSNKILKVKLISNQKAIVAGLEFAKQTFKLIDNKIKFNIKKKEGSSVKKNDLIAVIEGKIENILVGERVAFLSPLLLGELGEKRCALVRLGERNTGEASTGGRYDVANVVPPLLRINFFFAVPVVPGEMVPKEMELALAISSGTPSSRS